MTVDFKYSIHLKKFKIGGMFHPEQTGIDRTLEPHRVRSSLHNVILDSRRSDHRRIAIQPHRREILVDVVLPAPQTHRRAAHAPAALIESGILQQHPLDQHAIQIRRRLVVASVQSGLATLRYPLLAFLALLVVHFPVPRALPLRAGPRVCDSGVTRTMIYNSQEKYKLYLDNCETHLCDTISSLVLRLRKDSRSPRVPRRLSSLVKAK